MAMTDWGIIRRSMRSRKLSTWLTAATVAVAVGLMLVLLSMRDAGERAFSRGGGNMHLLLSRDTDSMQAVLNGLFYARPQRNYITWEKFLELNSWIPWQDPEKNPQLDDGFFIPTQQGDSFRGFPVLATTEAFFSRFKPTPDTAWALKEGAFFKGDFQVVLGSAAAKGTGMKVGDTLTFTHGVPAGAAGGGTAHEHDEFKFTVAGVLKPTGTAHDRGVFTSIQSSWILHAFDRIEKEGGGHDHEGHDHEGHDHAHGPICEDDLIDEDRKITGIYLRLVTAKDRDVSAALPQVFDRLRKDGGITVSQPKQEIDSLFRIVGNINQILVAMAAVVAVSSAVSIMLALYNSMDQRRRQVAVLRVLGCSKGRVMSLVLREAALLGAIGALVGVAGAIVGGRLVAAVMQQRLGLVVEPGLTMRWTAMVVLGAVVLAAIAGLAPAVMAYRTSVSKNLKPLG